MQVSIQPNPDISIHALREEGDAYRSPHPESQSISIHALREEGDFLQGKLLGGFSISIHALREEGDLRALNSDEVAFEISIHALREEGDTGDPVPGMGVCYFYPRPPRGGRRLRSMGDDMTCCDFYPRPPRGGRPSTAELKSVGFVISIHALREEGDSKCDGQMRM